MGSAFSQQQYVVAKPPTGRLTLATGTPVMSSEQADKQNIYYTPYVGAMVPIYDGTGWRERTFTELTLALAGSANWASGSNYDLFIVDDGGTLRLLTGPAWTNDTTRATAISRLNGLWVNGASMTGRYGASSTMTVGTNLGLYVGTVRMNASGQTTWVFAPAAAAGGAEGKLYLWNCYNRVAVCASSRDSTDTWTYTTNTMRATNGSNTNRISFVLGLEEDGIAALYVQGSSNGATAGVTQTNYINGIGLDSTSAFTGSASQVAFGATGVLNMLNTASCAVLPGLGYHYVQALEWSQPTSTPDHTLYGDAGLPTLVQEQLQLVGRF